MAAQLLAVQLNLQAGADASCIGPIVAAAQNLLVTVGYDGYGSGNISPSNAALLNYYNGVLDDYNNNEPLSCPIPLAP